MDSLFKRIGVPPALTSLVFAVLLFSIMGTLPSYGQTKAQYQNGDGSHSQSQVQLCPDPNNAGQTIACPTGGTSTTANQGSPNAGTTNSWYVQMGAGPGFAVGTPEYVAPGTGAVFPNIPAPTKSAGTYTAVTVGTSSASILAASTATVFLDFINNSQTATVCLFLGAGPATISGSLCAAGEITVPPLWHWSKEENFVPTDQIFAIASAASTAGSLGVK